MANRLLLLGCSNRKRSVSGYIRAIDLYDGPMFRVTRKALRSGDCRAPFSLYILSAKYGLLSGEDLVEWYDQKLTKGRIEELRSQVRNDLSLLLDREQFDECFLCMGSLYLDLVGRTGPFEARSIRTIVAGGGIGQRASQPSAG